MANEKLGTITILVKNRQAKAVNIQEILSKHGHMIMARLGVNVQPLCLKNCTGLITIVVKGNVREINGLKNELDKLYGIVAKKIIL